MLRRQIGYLQVREVSRWRLPISHCASLQAILEADLSNSSRYEFLQDVSNWSSSQPDFVLQELLDVFVSTQKVTLMSTLKKPLTANDIPMLVELAKEQGGLATVESM
jgi:hypothetical protein